MVFRDVSNAGNSNVEDDDDAVEDDDEYTVQDDYEGGENARNEPPTQTPPQTPNNSRNRNADVYRHDKTLGRAVNSNTNMTKYEAIMMLGVNKTSIEGK